jgi:ribosomal protein S18 acetylase RimI-like enzyme
VAEDLFVRELSDEEGPAPPSAGVPAVLREMQRGDARLLYGVYADAFSGRPGILLAEEAWTTKWPLHPQCIPRFSTVAVARAEPIGYVLAYEDPAIPNEGYIGQVGVRCDWHRKGVASGMMLRTMRAFRVAGLSSVALRVAQDNPQAISLYRNLGFSRSG